MWEKRIKAKLDEIYQPQNNWWMQPIHECVKVVTKQEAFNQYVQLWERIKKRLQAINKADDQAKFEILDKVLIDKI